MSATAESLAEPFVLAHTKRRLFPSDGEGYVVADTQFSRDQWLAGEPIEPWIREHLSPFNRVQIGGGYPDLLGVRRLEPEFLAIERQGSDPPLIAVEAKGRTTTGGVDTGRGIVQAYDRLNEANVAFVAVPISAVSESDRTLARELNVGILGVDATGTVESLETPRVIGNRTTTEASAIRFQASAQGVADQSFGLNHPKNYLGYPLALYADGSTEGLLEEYRVVGATDDARRGAAFLGLIDEEPTGPRLSGLGREVVRFAIREYGSADSALREFETWYRSRQRFVECAPRWGLLARQVLYSYPATQLLIDALQGLHEDGESEPPLVTLVEYLHVSRPSFTIELFVRGTKGVRRRVLAPDGELQRDALRDGSIYHAPTVFQLKTMLYHAGVLTDRGKEPHRLDPTVDVWALCETL